MNCPRDGEKLQEVKFDDIVLDRCPKCMGIWFDFAHLDRMLSHDARALRTLLPEGVTERMPDEEYLACPRCSDVLIRMFGKFAPKRYYACLSCYGRWLDGYELDRMIDRSLLDQYQRLVERLLH